MSILKNQLSDFAADLAKRRINVAALYKTLEDTMQWLDAAKKKFKATELMLEKEWQEKDSLEDENIHWEDSYKEAE